MYCYVITNTVNGKCYIGITDRLKSRWREHRYGDGSLLVYRAIKKYGIENFTFDPIFVGSEEETKVKEVEFIKAFSSFVPNGYNLTLGGEGSFGCVRSEETRLKLSESKIGKHGHPHTDETKQLMSKSRKGAGNGMFGKKLSEESRRKIGESLRRNKSGMLGKHHSDETKKKLSEKAKQRTVNANSHPIIVNNIRYECIADAARAIRFDEKTLQGYVCKFKKFGTWPRSLSSFKICLVQEKEIV